MQYILSSFATSCDVGYRTQGCHVGYCKRLLLEQKIDVIDSQWHKLAVRAIQVEQKTAEGDEDRPIEETRIAR